MNATNKKENKLAKHDLNWQVVQYRALRQATEHGAIENKQYNHGGAWNTEMRRIIKNKPTIDEMKQDMKERHKHLAERGR